MHLTANDLHVRILLLLGG